MTAPSSYYACITNYKIYYSSGTFITSVPYTNTTQTVLINGLNYNTLYSFYVTSSSSNDNSIPSNTYSVTTLPVLPPTGLTATILTALSINLTWVKPSNCVTGYTIYEIGNTSPIATSLTTSYTVTGLTYGSTYTFSVLANYNNINSSAVNSNTITLPYYINITATNYNTTLSQYTPSSGIIVFDNTNSSGTFTINSAVQGATINTICIGAGGNGGNGLFFGLGTSSNGGGGGGGGGYINSSSFTASSYLGPTSCRAYIGYQGNGTTSALTYGPVPGGPIITSTQNGGDGGNATFSGAGSGGIGSTNGGAGANVFGGQGNNSLSISSFVINNITYKIYYGASGGGGGAAGGSGGSGGITGGGNGGAGTNGNPGTSSYTSASSMYTLYYGNGGGGGSYALNTNYNGGNGSQGIVIIYWSS